MSHDHSRGNSVAFNMPTELTHRRGIRHVRIVTTGMERAKRSVRGVDTSGMLIKANVSWDLSWKHVSALGTDNWDAAWLFVKYRVKGSSRWRHAVLATDPSSHVRPQYGVVQPAEDGVGVFLYAGSDGFLVSADYRGLELFWPQPEGLALDDVESVWVIGLQMVYVPEGPFYIGDPKGLSNQFSDAAAVRKIAGGQGKPKHGYCHQITSEAAIPVVAPLGASPVPDGAITWNNKGQPGTRADIPAAYPKGTKGFYMMKNKVTQGEYADFVNSLHGQALTVRYPYGGEGSYRFSLRWTKGQGRAALRPLRACNWLSWADSAGFLWWAGLRPMTEFEFTKACRGPADPVANEYAWGNADLHQAQVIVGQEFEFDMAVLGNCNIDNTRSPFDGGDGGRGPLPDSSFAGFLNPSITPPGRYPGAFASPDGCGNHEHVGMRSDTGATYYGAFGMSGNLWEFVATAGNDAGRAFTGDHGDGNLDAEGDANENASWPNRSGQGAGFRGGSWYTPASRGKVADRSYAAGVKDYSVRSHDTGVRGVRTAGPALD